jgi:hypothetical protein
VTEQRTSRSGAKPASRYFAALLRAIQVVVFVVAAGLLAMHSLKWERPHVDTTSLALLGFLVVTPLLERITRIRFGDFEAEIARDEVRRARAKVEDELAPAPEDGKARSLEDEIRELVQRDPQLALAKVRIELEDVIKRLHFLAVPNQSPTRYQSLVRRVDDLARLEVVSPTLRGAVRDVLSLANRAIHGERVEHGAAEDLALLGVRLVAELNEAFLGHLMRAVETEEINRAELSAALEAQYRVTTIVPYVDKPLRNTYVLDQDGLDQLLDGYEEYGEFIVAVERID